MLLEGVSAPLEVRTVRLPLVNYYSGSGKPIMVALDVTDGLDRSREDPALVAAGRSITEPADPGSVPPVRECGRLDPAAGVPEPRRGDQPYSAGRARAGVLRGRCDGGSRRGRAAGRNTTSRLLVSVQVETAWGGLQGGSFVGVAQDRMDFPSIDALGLSSYPWLGGYPTPEDIPDYDTRLVADSPIPELVLEGGMAVGGGGPRGQHS